MDVIDSGPERPAGPADRWLRQAARQAGRLRRFGGRQRRTATVVLAVLVAIGVMTGLRSGLSPSDRPAGRQAQLWAGPAGPPYDSFPGRTPIPPPRLVSEDGQRVSGVLPITDGPSEVAAQAAVDLVIGRYCRAPAEHSTQLIRPRGMVGRYPGYGGYRVPRPGPGPDAGTPNPGPSPIPGPSADPGAGAPQIEPWTFVVAVVTTPATGHFDAVVTLSWVGSSYWWGGSLAQLNSCH